MIDGREQNEGGGTVAVCISASVHEDTLTVSFSDTYWPDDTK